MTIGWVIVIQYLLIFYFFLNFVFHYFWHDFVFELIVQVWHDKCVE